MKIENWEHSSHSVTGFHTHKTSHFNILTIPEHEWCPVFSFLFQFYSFTIHIIIYWQRLTVVYEAYTHTHTHQYGCTRTRNYHLWYRMNWIVIRIFYNIEYYTMFNLVYSIMFRLYPTENPNIHGHYDVLHCDVCHTLFLYHIYICIFTNGLCSFTNIMHLTTSRPLTLFWSSLFLYIVVHCGTWFPASCEYKSKNPE